MIDLLEKSTKIFKSNILKTMKGKLHLMAGFSVGISEAAILLNEKGAVEAYGFAAAAIIGSLIPDSDLPNTKISTHLPFTSKIINKLFGHRGFIHTPLCAALFTGIIYFSINHFFYSEIAWIIASGFLCGFLMHLLQDSFTKGGIMFLYPFSKSRISFTKLRSNSKMHLPITIGLIAIWLYFITFSSEIVLAGSFH